MATTHAIGSTRAGRHAAVPGAGLPTARLTLRLIRRGVLALALGIAAYLVIEVLAYEIGYPDAQSRATLTLWGQDPGIRMVAGPAIAVDTVGGFVAWDAGLYLTLVLGAWALTATTRVLRGDEDTGRTDLMLVGPVTAPRALLAQIVVLLGACVVMGLTVALALSLSGAQAWGSVLYGASLAGYCAALVGLAAVACQILSTRGAALGSTAAVLVGWILLRMVSNSADSRSWLGWLTPTGWGDKLRAFDDNRWLVLVLPVAVGSALVAGAVLLRRSRDSGAGLVADREGHRSRSWGLGSPLGFAWRSNQAVLLAWGAGIAVAALAVGAMLPAIEEFLGSDEGFLEILAAMGMAPDDLTLGFVAMAAVILGLVVAVYCAFRMGSARVEEASTRAEALLTRPVARWRWLGGHAACAAAGAVLLCGAAAAALWLGAIATGAGLDPADPFAAMVNVLPMVSVFAGLAVLVFGVAPRLTVVLPAAAAVAAYVLEVVGPLFDWPGWVVGISPFHHLSAVPVDPVGIPAALVMVSIAAVLAVAGILAFQRRDLIGA